MVESLRRAAAVQLEGDHQPRLNVHRGADLKGRADCIRHVQRFTLIRHVNPRGRNTGPSEICMGSIELVFGVDAKSKALTNGSRSLLNDEAMVTRLFHPAEIERLGIFVAHDEAKCINIEGAAGTEITRGENDVTGTGDVDQRWVGGVRNAHRSPV
jgi:hypothetical protein